ncbi:gluconate 2-dehydrogenase subunit 3 family protein [Flavihumibacter profundi]|uniref:gluconate 2-dehydrogenase subunit 3 family protein n=1 Tax=Flavihumibacter profundi TaxID=2716883 RepID=UPI001CC685BC|nr:gluconate 2-dehydrogenase subunit 3 family protein [Flavihumibacter profundi]MBZ5857303.1 gluconate 2-dehydrogenase subunit 3 family protein [Flavihumibacter profundi]
MNRRQSIKALSVTALSAGLLLDACKTDTSKNTSEVDHTNLEYAAGLQDFEKERLEKLYAQPNFFNEHERNTLVILGDLIIPADAVSGSASDAKVIDFIEFIVKDIPDHQVPLRGGLKWLDMQCFSLYGKSFSGCSKDQQVEMLELIAYPGKTKPEFHQGEEFFNRVRNLVATGFYTSKVGIKDLGYVGNTPNKWKGVPAEVLQQYNLKDE